MGLKWQQNLKKKKKKPIKVKYQKYAPNVMCQIKIVVKWKNKIVATLCL